MISAQIDWEGPLDWHEVVRTKTDNNQDCGIYQICGTHVVHGGNTLLYVGKTDRRTFSARMQEHDWWLKHERDIAVFLGRIRQEETAEADPDPGWRNWMKLLGHVESLTIYWHSPPYNSHYIARYRGPLLHVRCTGNRGRILKEYSSDWSKPVPNARPDYQLVATFGVDGIPYGFAGGPEAWRVYCRDIAKRENPNVPLPITNPVKIVVQFRYQPTSGPWDLDNALKLLIDALGAAGYFPPSTSGGRKSEWNTNDGVVARIEAEKACVDGEPRTVVEVWAAKSKD